MPPLRGRDAVFEADDNALLPYRQMTPASFNPQSTLSVSPVSPTTTDTSSYSTSTLPSYMTEDPSSSPSIPATTTTTTTTTTYTRTSHGKKRDASYIPRPPNAFILFRSSFIRSQRVPGNVEGNHSTLSKIIGKYWKALPREEREKWEKEALAAQAEHRRKYPDWRFRPGANTVATKFKTKDSPALTTTRRRLVHKRSKDSEGVGVDREHHSRTREKGKGKAKEKETPTVEEEEERLTKIVQLLVDRKEGKDLEIAVEKWEDGRRRISAQAYSEKNNPLGSKSKGPRCGKTQSEDTIDGRPDDILVEGSSRGSNSPPLPDSSDFAKIPLTHWFKRSQSEPVAPCLPPVESANPLTADAPALSNTRTTVPVVVLSAGADARSSPRDLDDHDRGVPSPDSWWTPHISGGFNPDTTGLGYENIHIGSFNPDHISQFETSLDSQSDGGAAINWTKTSGGYVAAVEDPFINDKRGAEVEPAPSVSDALSSLSRNTLQSAPMIVYPREPPSSFSSLAGWAGGASATSMPNETKAIVYGLSDSPYDLYYGDWNNSHS
ncbi:hypothetical protein AX15_002388 [Amanita polypyramis BW_CC]|nr:hypothetical protein AX15_002388 [Amanita polypyramis BW_CC]